MSVATATVTAESLQAFANAWNRHDVDQLMSFMTDDCVFQSSAGPDVCGTRYAGRDQVRAGYIWVNGVGSHYPAMAYGGFKNSGVGREEGIEEMLSYTETKAIHLLAKR